MTEDERTARAAIEKTLAACTQAGDSRKAEQYAQCFAEDGVLHLAEKYEGRAAIHGFMAAPSVIAQPAAQSITQPGTQSQTPSPGFVSHHLTTCRIDMTSPTTATVRTYWLVTTAVGLDHNGYYDDRFAKYGDEWLILYRRPRTLWISPASLIARS